MKSYKQFLNEAKAQKAVTTTHTGEVFVEVNKNGGIVTYNTRGIPLDLTSVAFKMPRSAHSSKYSAGDMIEKAIKDRVVNGNEPLDRVLADVTGLEWKRA